MSFTTPVDTAKLLDQIFRFSLSEFLIPKRHPSINITINYKGTIHLDFFLASLTPFSILFVHILSPEPKLRAIGFCYCFFFKRQIGLPGPNTSSSALSYHDLLWKSSLKKKPLLSILFPPNRISSPHDSCLLFYLLIDGSPLIFLPVEQLSDSIRISYYFCFVSSTKRSVNFLSNLL